ncbi:MAG: hypothetical protein O9295_07350 [Microcystis sp. LE18-22.4A]|jgi:hypothetical protein|uniref:hypothetical protein n=1 Tax=Microcystis sp. LE18-22.4A TaxID=3016432 RepID=UPI0022C16E09|nr:hypothetical protein [Microcystis sp. LE18-22.4A]MCZ8117871.1 hypothetical protein [Microcystis sp. LE18-22.4A]
MQSRTPGIHNLCPEIFHEQIEDLRKIGIDLYSGLELALAQSVIINTLGRYFWAKECTTFGHRQDFFANKSDVRIIHLAHMLWSLKDQEGFAEFLRNKDTNNFESTYYELTAAYWFLKSSKSVRLVVESGVKGADFDIEVKEFFLYNSLNVEVKAKQIDFTTEQQIINKFKKTRSQLPQDGNGVIFCKVNLSGLLTQKELIQAAQIFLKSTKRIAFIVYCWDSWNLIQEGIALAYIAVNREGEMHSIFGESSTPVRPAFLVEAIEWHQQP